MGRPRNVLEVDRLTAGWTLLERMREVALELENLEQFNFLSYWESSARRALFRGDYAEVYRICDLNDDEKSS